MTITLNLPENAERKLERLATQHGSIEAAVVKLLDAVGSPTVVESEAAKPKDGKVLPKDMPYEEWKVWLDELVAMGTASGENLNDDRARFYPDPMR